MSSYGKIDDALQEWAAVNGVSWSNMYQDCEVRTFFLLSTDNKKNIQVWIDGPIDHKFNINISDNNKIRRKMRLLSISTDFVNILNDLDKALAAAKGMI